MPLRGFERTGVAMATTKAFINPAMLTWARQQSYPTAEAAGAALHEPRLPAWEAGAVRPTFNQAQTLASRLHIPFGYLFLAGPPDEYMPLPDFRTVAHRASDMPSRELIDVVDDAYLKQQWRRDYLAEEGAEPLTFINAHTLDTPVVQVANSIDELFGVRELARRVEGRDIFLRELTHRVEELGVAVMRSGFALGNNTRELNVNEFRGFAITDELAPLIFINARDGLGAQIFTFIHEIAHLLFGKSGISNPNFRNRIGTQDDDVEDVCDSVTAETLMPEKDFLDRWRTDRTISQNLGALTRLYKASTLAIMRRARDLDKISAEMYWSYYDSNVGTTANTSGSGTFYPTFFIRNSRLVVSSVIMAVSEQRLAYRDAASLLNNVRVQTLDGAAIQLFGVGIRQ